jgi:hypothetical protein
MRRTALLLGFLAVATLGALTAQRVTLPTLWQLSPPVGNATTLGTMPQGIALSPDGAKLAVVESGFNPPALRILATDDLHILKTIPLKDAFGIPVWVGADSLYVAGGAADSVFLINIISGTVSQVVSSKGWPDAVTMYRSSMAVANDDAGTVTVHLGCSDVYSVKTDRLCFMNSSPDMPTTIPVFAERCASLRCM